MKIAASKARDWKKPKLYHVRRLRNERIIAVVEVLGTAKPQRYRLRHIKHHSPTGFETGYEGSGPADLALAILADYFGESSHAVKHDSARSPSWLLHHDFKRVFIAPRKETPYTIASRAIDSWHQQMMDLFGA